MDPVHNVARFWNWLPAFRAIGETSHLPSAAAAVHLSPSALSRSLKQLENSLGRQLFRRTNRRLELTREGELFLASLRDAMRIVHEASLTVQSRELRGNVCVGSSGVATLAWVLPALLELRERHTELVPDLRTDLDDVVQALLKGELDIVFHSTRVNHSRLRTERIGVARAGVYCGPTHELYDKRRVTLDDLRERGFVAPPPSEHGISRDGWPAELERKIEVYVDRHRLGVEVCLASPLLGVFPDLVAEKTGRGELRRLPVDVVPAASIFAALLPPLAKVTAAEVVLDAVRARMG